MAGRCGGELEFSAGEQRSQSRMSMSWQDFVSNEGADVDSFLQCPLFLISSYLTGCRLRESLTERSCVQSATTPPAPYD